MKSGHVFRPGHVVAAEGGHNGRYDSDYLPALPQAGQRLCLHTVLFVSRTPYLQRMGLGRNSQAVDSSTPEIWLEETSILYRHLCSRGYPRWFLRTVFEEVT